MNILIVAGAVFAALYIVSAGVGAARRVSKMGGGLLLLAAAGLTIASGVFYPSTMPFAFGVVGALFVLSVVIAVVERTRTQQMARGVAGVVGAVLMGVGLFATPYVQQGVTSIAAGDESDVVATQMADARRAVSSRNSVPVQSDDLLPVGDFEAQPQPTRPALEPTVTPTPFTYELPTPVPPICNGTVTVNVNFREDPALDADIITVIAEGTLINVFERDESGEWLRTMVDERWGWVSSTVVTVEGDC